jgi:hypothetical protein
MSRRFKAMLLWVVMLWALLPQLACFLPEAAAKPNESECCHQMPEHCGKQNPPSNSSVHTCCAHILLSYVFVTIKAQDSIDPPVESAATLPEIELALLPRASGWLNFLVPNFHAPPHDLSHSLLNLRI